MPDLIRHPADRVFRGNTCAVCVFPSWPADSLLQAVATQNRAPETAFIVPGKERPQRRWSTISQEVDFCGHGTLAAGFAYLSFVAPDRKTVAFDAPRHGFLTVQKAGDLFQIDIPLKRPLAPAWDNAVEKALGDPRPEAMIPSERGDLLILYENEKQVRALRPDFLSLMATGYYGYVPTSPGLDADYAYRYFSPRMPGFWEDPVNGASQSVLIPYWASRLGKNKLWGQACSSRGGTVFGEKRAADTVRLGGKVCLYSQGVLAL